MYRSKARLATLACGLVAALLVVPSESRAGLFDWLYPSSTPPVVSTTSYLPAYTTYMPVYTAPRISLMPVLSRTSYSPVPQTCYYTPQTKYRWTFSRMPVTTYRPVTTVDPCTGCTSVAYQPVTTKTLLPWLHREPYTAYRVTCSPLSLSSCPSLSSPCSTSSYLAPGFGSPTSTLGALSGSSCASCAPAGPPASTFKTEEATGESGEATQQPELRMKPTPEVNSNPASTKRPRVISPENRTAARPVQYAAYYRPIQRVSATSARSGAPLDLGGWYASHD